MKYEYRVIYCSAPVSEVAKTTTVKTDIEGLSKAEAAECVNKINSLLKRPMVTDEDIVRVDRIGN